MRAGFYKDLVNYIQTVSVFDNVKFNTLATDTKAIGIVDRPSTLGVARLNHKRDVILQFDLLVKSSDVLEALEELERLTNALDMKYINNAYVKLYTNPQFAYKDDNNNYIYVSSFNVEIERG